MSEKTPSLPSSNRWHVPHSRVSIDFPGKLGKSLTVQSMKAECDVNNILKKYRETGLVTHVNQHQGQYGDFTSVTDFATAMNVVVEAQAMFDSLPSHIRDYFANSPEHFLNAVGDPDRKDELVALGVLPNTDFEAEPFEENPASGGTSEPENEPPEEAPTN